MKKVLTKIKSIPKNLIATFAVVAAVFGIAGYAIVNAGEEPVHHKTISDNHDGTHKISLDITGRADITSTSAKANILLVYDTSGSMLGHFEDNTGSYGHTGNYINQNWYQLYKVTGRDWWGNNTYAAITDDEEYTGTVYYNRGYGYERYNGTRYTSYNRAALTEKAVNTFVGGLLSKNTEEEPDNVEIALVTFSTSAETKKFSNKTWVKDNTIKNWFNSDGVSYRSNTYGGYTNWEDALDTAKTVLAAADSDPTYVIFITDGAPTANKAGTGNSGSYNVSYYRDARDEALAIQNYNTDDENTEEGASNTELYAIYAFGNEADNLDDLIYYAHNGSERDNVTSETDETEYYYKADDNAKLQAAIDDIFAAIIDALGITNAAITDGTTSKVTASSGNIDYKLLSIDEESYEYWMTFPITGTSNEYKITRSNLVTGESYEMTIKNPTNCNGNICTYECTWEGHETPVAVTGIIDTYQGTFKYKWTEKNDFYKFDAPEAKFIDGAVKWDLSPVGTLLNGVTYTVTFDVWPSQYTLDTIADIKNGLKNYSELDSNVKQYLKCDAAKNCKLYTNTAATISYDDTSDGTSGNVLYTDRLEPVPTKASEMTIEKLWNNAMGDKYGANEYAESGVTFNVIKGNDTTNPYDTKTLKPNAQGEWKNSVYISAGVIQNKGNKAYIRETGHDYTFAEIPSELDYHWDLEVETVRPMIIDGNLTTLVKVEENAPTIGDSNKLVDAATGLTYYKITEKINGKDVTSVYYVREQSSAVMKATNVRRSNLNITKEVLGENSEDAEFTFDLKVEDYNGENLWFSIWSPEEGTITDDKYVTITDEANNLVEKELDDETNEFNGFYSVKSETPLTVTLKAGWNLRFTNLPIGSEYTFEEKTMPNNYVYDDSEGTSAVIQVSILPVGAVSNGNGTYTYTNNGKTTIYTEVKDSSNEVIGYTYKAEVTKNNKKVTGEIYTGNTSYIVKYTNVSELTNLTVNKIWEDNNNNDGKRPNINLHLFADGSELTEKAVTLTSDNAVVNIVDDKEVVDENTWTYTFTDLPKYKDGKEIKYTVTEDAVAEYNKKDNYPLYNDKVSFDILSKNANENETIAVTLLANGEETENTVTLNKENNFKATIEGLDYLDDNGNMITYTTKVTNGSTATVRLYSKDKTIEITNEHEDETIELSGTKTWVDNGNTSIKPTSIYITLTGTVTGVEKPIYQSKIEVTNDAWTFSNLPKYHEGKEITYTLTEDKVPGYTSEVNGYNVTNTLEEVSVPVTKTWADGSNQDGKRPAKITVRLLANGKAVDSKVVELSSANATDVNTWTYTFEHLNAKDAKGEPITYTVSEDDVKNTDNVAYAKDVSCEKNVCTITNTLDPETIELSGTKTWVDHGNTTIKPASIKVTLTGKVTGVNDPVYSETKTITDDKWTFSNLPKYHEGKEITYTLTEDKVPGYRSEVDGYNVTNTLEEVSVPVTKTWADGSNQDGKRPAKITVRLLANGKAVDGKVVELSSANATDVNTWTYTFEHLNAKDAKGEPITYTVSEDDVKNTDNVAYAKDVSCEKNVCTITNTLAPETIALSGTKTWVDHGNTSIKPASIKVTLTGKVTGVNDPVYSETKTITDDKWTFSNLPKYYEGKEITYTLTEDKVPGYRSEVNGYNVTNTLEEVSVPVTKTWADGSNQDGKRPAKITVRLLANGKAVDGKVVELSSANATDVNTWTYTFEHLNAKDAKGEPITYTVSEDDVKNTDNVAYASNVSCEKNVCTITNTLDPETIELSGTKTWVDNGNTTIKPTSIYITLTGTVTGVEKPIYQSKIEVTNDAWTFSNLPKYHEGKEITYTLTEDKVPGYRSEVNGYNVTNTLEEVSVPVTKTWADGSNQDGKRPAKITVRLLANGKAVDDKVVELSSANATDVNTWTYTFEHLNAKDAKGEPITYTVSEDDVKNTDNVAYAKDVSCEKNVCTITNTLAPETIALSGTKTWVDHGNTSIKPASIKVTLTGKVTGVNDPVYSETKTITDDKWTFSNLPKYHEGKEITYTLTEDKVPGYRSEVNGYNVTNTLEEVSVPVTKTWADGSNQDGKRPAKITVRLLANGKAVDGKVVELSSANATDVNTWTYTFEHLNAKDAKGEPITYTVSEDDVKNTDNVAYASNVSCEKNVCTITNTLAPETIALSGTKTWVDNGNTTIKPASIKVTLTGKVAGVNDPVYSETKTITDDKWTFSNLPKYYEGKEITYTLTEDKVPGYRSEVNGYNVTNTLEEVSVPVIKKWDDVNNQDGTRPDTITIRLLANGKAVDGKVVELSSANATDVNTWTYTFEHLNAKDAKGEPISYSVSEDGIDESRDYRVAYASTLNNETGITTHIITNKHTPGLTNVPVTKIWADGSDQDGKRPENITIRLLADGKPVTDKVATLNAKDNAKDKDTWTYKFTDLPKYRDGGVEIEYTVSEDVVKNTDDKTYASDVSCEKNVCTITNTLNPETTSLSGIKVWKDNDNQDGIRPAAVTIRLLADGKAVKSTTATADSNWEYSFTGIPKYRDGGVEIKYTVSEDTVPGYTTSINGTEITNTHVPATTEVVGKKVWQDANNLEGYRPTTITVRLYADNTEIDSTEVSAETANEQGEWLYSFTGLPKYRNGGTKIEYTISEDEVSNYETSYDEDNPYIIINTHSPKELSITVNKEWNETSLEGIQDKYGHTDSIKVRLEGKVNDNVYYDETVTIEANEEGKWTYTFTELPEYREGTEIKYTAYEVTEVTEYSVATEIDKKNNIITITNTYTPGSVTIDGEKIWDDADNQDGIRPKSITVNLLADGEIIATDEVKPNDEGKWLISFTNLPQKHNKKDIEYTLEEVSVEGYTSTIDNYNITNSHTPETVSFIINKIWEDNEDNDGYRPESITIRILNDLDEEVAKEIVTADEEGNWNCEFKDLPKYKEGKPIEYRIVEDAVKTYSTEIKLVNEENNEYEIINTHEAETTEITITKTWDDYDDISEIRPEEIKVDIIANDEVVETITITATDGWTKTIKGLPKWLNGELIDYRILEHEIPEYDTTYTGNANDGFTIINKHELGKGNGGDEPEILPPQTGIEIVMPNINNNYLLYLVLILISILGINIEFIKNN